MAVQVEHIAANIIVSESIYIILISADIIIGAIGHVHIVASQELHVRVGHGGSDGLIRV